jgi:hypothetical protein
MKIYDSANFSNLPGELHDLFAAGANESFFNLPEWYDIVARHGLESGWAPRLYASNEAVFIGSVAKAENGGEIRGCCNMYTIDHCVLAVSAPVVGQLFVEIAGTKPIPDGILLPGLDPAGTGFTAALAGLKQAGFLARSYFCWGSWYETTSGRNFDAYLAARPSALRNTWRRKLAALEKSHRVEFRTSGDVERFVLDYEEVYRRSWKPPEPFPEFLPALMRMASRKGALRFGVLEVDGKPVAAQFWIVWKGRAIIYKLAYDENLSAFSPGTVLTFHMIRRVLEHDRPDEINFGRGDDDYKKLFMSARRERWGIEAVNPRSVRALPRSMRLVGGMLRDRFLKRWPLARPGANAAEESL